jgi:hypothetical protein
MSTLGDALAAIKSIVLLEERVRNQGAKLDKLAEAVFEMDRRLIRVETTLDIVLCGKGDAVPPVRVISHDPER